MFLKIFTASRLGWLGAAALAAVIVACGPSEEQKRAEDAVKEPGAAEPAKVVLHRGNSAEPSTLDPHRASGTWENNIIGDLFMGLMTENPEGQPIAGTAESWETSEDGLVWTFKLREHTWSDGVPVTAEDFAFAYRRILAPETAARYASILYPIKNARAVNAGEMEPEALGVRAVDDRTFEITLEYPAPFLPQMLTHYTTYPVPKHAVEKYGDSWVQPENVITNGAYVLAEWRPNDFIRTVKNPAFFDADNVKIDEVYFYPTDDRAAAVRRYRAGELDMNDDFPIGQYQDLKERFGDEIKGSVFLETDYLTINLTNEKFKGKPGVRRALGLAIDRNILVNKVRRLEETPAFAFVPPPMANYVDGVAVDYKGGDMEARREEARRLLAEAGYT
ncbi:MAG: peptide ABC transporter substrate-binding protein, partial [Alphaproteobacteria bacterium]